jgi:hypothetical protein
VVFKISKKKIDLFLSLGFADESELLKYLVDPFSKDKVLGGTVFEKSDPDDISYKIRLSYSPRNSGENA